MGIYTILVRVDKMASFDLKNTSRNRSNRIVTKTCFEPAYFHITHIPVQRAFTVFSKYSGQYIFNLKNSLYITIPISPVFFATVVAVQFASLLAVCLVIFLGEKKKKSCNNLREAR